MPSYTPLHFCLIATSRNPVHEHRPVLIEVIFYMLDTPVVPFANRQHLMTKESIPSNR